MRKTDLVRFIHSNSSKQEEEEIFKWLEASPANKKYFNDLRNLWISMGVPQERAEEREYLKFTSRFPIKQKRGRGIKKYYILATTAVASLLLLFFALKLSHHSNKLSEKDYLAIVNTKDEIMYYTLPDKSKISLFPKAEICYHEKTFSEKRNVVLQGKAFFEIASNIEKPFQTYTRNNIEIKVTGTKFFLSSTIEKANPQENRFEAFLQEGKIAVKRRNENTEIHLNPGDMLVSNGDLEFVKVSGGTMPKEMELLHANLCFENTKMSTILHKLENYYNVSFVCTRGEITDFLFTGDLNQKSLDFILTLFDRSMNIKHSVNKDIITLY